MFEVISADEGHLFNERFEAESYSLQPWTAANWAESVAAVDRHIDCVATISAYDPPVLMSFGHLFGCSRVSTSKQVRKLT